MEIEAFAAQFCHSSFGIRHFFQTCAIA